MEKIKLTQEQADAIERIEHEKHQIINGHVTGTWKGELAPLNDLHLDQLIRALYIGYEAESEFKAGSWVSCFVNGIEKIVRIVGFAQGEVIVEFYKIGCKYVRTITKKDIKRHATDREIKTSKQNWFWYKNNRNVLEVRKGDILYDEELGELMFVRTNATLSEVGKGVYKVVCFVEDRKDVVHDYS